MENGAISEVSKTPEEIINPVDTAGAGDAFFSVLLREYAYSDKIDKAFVDRVFPMANNASKEALLRYGSRK